MAKEILLGTNNPHKALEISQLLTDLPLKIRTLAEFSAVPDVEETGRTLEENAVLKARYYARATGLFTLADDSGLEVSALDGAPGVYSARYAGKNCSYEDNNRKLLQELLRSPKKDRAALFRCVIALCDPETDSVRTVEASVRGEIVGDLQGRHGFGYDPVFYVPEIHKTFAELTRDEKNLISHRALAILKAKEILKTICQGS